MNRDFCRGLLLLLVAVAAIGCGKGEDDSSDATDQAKSPKPLPGLLRYVTPEHKVVLRLFPSRMFSSGQFRAITSAGDDPRVVRQLLLNHAPEEVEESVVLMGDVAGPLRTLSDLTDAPIGFLVRLHSEVDIDKIRRGFASVEFEEATEGDTTLYRPKGEGPLLAVIDQRTLLVALNPPHGEAMLKASKIDTPLGAALRKADLEADALLVAADAEPLKAIAPVGAAIGMSKPAIENAQKYFDEIEELVLAADFAGGPLLKGHATTGHDASAEDLADSASKLKQTLDQLVGQAKSDSDAYLSLVRDTLAETRIEREGKRVQITIPRIPGWGERAQELIAADEAKKLREASVDKLRVIAKALSDYQTARRRFPADVVDDEGEPLLSWRVMLLPYLGETTLFARFKLDEPFDSPHNKQLIEQMPEAYRHPDGDETGMTRYLAPIGENTLITAAARGRGIAAIDVLDGVGKTLAFVEVGPDQAAPWTRPGNWQYSPEGAVEKLGTIEGDNYLVVLADGRIAPLPKSVTDAQLRQLVERNDGKPAFSIRSFLRSLME